MDTLNLAQLLSDRLGIEIPPVGIAFVDSEPLDMPRLYRESPSFCSLWRMAELKVFYAPAEQHAGCGIGGMVSGFLSAEGRESELAELLEEMCEADVGSTDEIAETPRFHNPGAGAIYGPLWNMPVELDLALMWATLPQMGVVQEIVGKVMWKNNPQGASFTRPACAVLPIAYQHEKPALSLGCVGMRLYTGLPSYLFLVAIPPEYLPKLEEGLESMTDAPVRIQRYAAKMAAGR